MLLRLLLLKRLSPFWYRVKLVQVIFFGLLFLAFIGQLGYYMFREVTRSSPHPTVQTSQPRR
jgi:hypothetical protein